jgi:hypothetical protein
LEGGWFERIDGWSREHQVTIDVLLALTLASVLGALTLSTLQDTQVSSPWLIGAAFGVLHGSVALRRSAPGIAYATASIAMLGIVAAPNLLASGKPH